MAHLNTQNPTEETEIDRLILERLIRVLEPDPQPDPDQESPSSISFFVRNRVVTVSGSVFDAEERESLIASVMDTEGVERVINRINDRQSPN